MRRTTRMVNGKPPKNIAAKTSSFFLRKKFWVCDNRTTQLRASLYQNPSIDWRGSPLAIYFRLGKSGPRLKSGLTYNQFIRSAIYPFMKFIDL